MADVVFECVIGGLIASIIFLKIWVSGRRVRLSREKTMMGLIAPVIADGPLEKNKLITEDPDPDEDELVVKVNVVSYYETSNMNGDVMRTITMSEADAQQIKAIMLTHAELQDLRSVESTELFARMKSAGDSEMDDMAATLLEQVEEFDHDSSNLRRIAQLF